MINIRDMTFRYGRSDFSLAVPSLTVPEGTHVALIGPSGSGKSTLINLMAGILVPDEGTVSVGGQPVSDLSESVRRAFRLSRIGMIFQSLALLPYLTVRDNVLLPVRLGGQAADDETVARYRELLAAVGLTGQGRRYPGQLSQGEQQRVAICRALINRPQVVLADEPTGNLDHDNAAGVLDLMLAQVRASGATLLMATHDRSLYDAFDKVVDITDLQGGP